MRFPYRSSIPEDIRALFGRQRADATARTLGSSSLRQGEGAVRLLSADGSTALAVFGDLPNGGSGVGILSGGVIRTVPEIVSGATGPLISRIGELEAFKAYADNQITNLNAASTAHSNRLSGLETFKNYADNQITALLGFSTTTANRLGDLESNRTWQDGQITNINTNLGSLNANRTWADGQIASLSSSVGSLGTSVGAVAGRATSLESRVSALENRMYQAEQQLGQQQDQINVINRRINQGGIPP